MEKWICFDCKHKKTCPYKTRHIRQCLDYEPRPVINRRKGVKSYDKISSRPKMASV